MENEDKREKMELKRVW